MNLLFISTVVSNQSKARTGNLLHSLTWYIWELHWRQPHPASCGFFTLLVFMLFLKLMVMMGGLLPDVPQQLSAVAIYHQTTNAMCFMLSLVISTAVSTRCCRWKLGTRSLRSC